MFIHSIVDRGKVRIRESAFSEVKILHMNYIEIYKRIIRRDRRESQKLSLQLTGLVTGLERSVLT